MTEKTQEQTSGKAMTQNKTLAHEERERVIYSLLYNRE